MTGAVVRPNQRRLRDVHGRCASCFGRPRGMSENRLQRLIYSNPLRAGIQELECRYLQGLGRRSLRGKVAMEVGCGAGYGVDAILNVFGVGRVDAFDLDGELVEHARARLARRGRQVRVFQGDCEAIDVPPESYDAVFDFAVVHHVKRWRRAIEQVFRVLKPGGLFYGVEVLDRFILNPLARRLLDHPLEDRFSHDGFRTELRRAGFALLETRQIADCFGWYVAERPASNGGTHAR
jgi:SAM-dependent methyltransferase